MRFISIAALCALVVLVGAAASLAAPVAPSASVKVPNVVGMRLDRATRTLQRAGLRVNEECSGLFGCIAKSRWVACVQTPRAGRRVLRWSVVVVYAERRGRC
jgi:hypothetical protein